MQIEDQYHLDTPIQPKGTIPGDKDITPMDDNPPKLENFPLALPHLQSHQIEKMLDRLDTASQNNGAQVPKLKGSENCKIWCVYILNHLHWEQVSDILNLLPTPKRSSVGVLFSLDATKDAYDLQCTKAHRTITAYLLDSIALNVEHLGTVQAKWDYLHKCFQGTNIAMMMFYLMDEFSELC